jgi:hypothetical protein
MWKGCGIEDRKQMDDLLKKAIRVRIERIFSHNGTPEDIRLVFSDLRFGRGCPPEVRDLADFAAHRPEKDRGRLLNRTSKLYKQLRMHLRERVPLNVHPAYTDAQVTKAIISYCVSSGVLELPNPIDLGQLIPLVAL